MVNKIECAWCGKLMFETNKRRHAEKCVWKNEVKIKKSEFEKMRNEGLFQDVCEQKKLKDDLQNENLKNFILENYEQFTNLYKSIMDFPEVSDPESIIKNILVCDSTKEQYLLEWRLFKNYMNENRKPLSLDSANSYIGSLECKPSTIKKKIAVIQTILRTLINPTISKY
jgi:hypothetical protein